MKKVKEFFNSYKFSTIKSKIEDMGYAITPKTIFLYIILTALLSIFLGTVLQLKLAYSLIVVLFFILCIPQLLIYKFKFYFERVKFNDIVNYMERLIYAYQNSGKLYTALQDVQAVSSGRIEKYIRKALNFIDNGKAKENLYKEALNIIEKKYNCTRLVTLHNYLVDVETNGGISEQSLNLILEDVRAWSLRTQEYKSNRGNIKNKVILSIVFAIITCIAALFLVPKEYTSQMTESVIYQVGTVLALISYIGVFVYTQKTIAISYLDLEDEEDTNASYFRALKRIDKFNAKNVIKKAIISLVLGIGFCVTVHLLDYDIFMIPIGILFGFIAYQPIFTNKKDKDRVIKEIKKSFPVWLRNMVLLLQINNVNVAIQLSLKTCPTVLKPHIEKLLKGIEENPASSEPFDKFCEEYDLPDMKLTVHFLYYLSTFDSDEMIGQLDYIVQQNTHFTLNEEKIRNEDSLSMMGMLILLPMGISIMKLVLDMYSLFGVMQTLFSTTDLLG